MRTHPHSRPSSFASIFGFLVLALVLSTVDCRFNRAKAQEEDELTYKTKWCNRAYLESVYGEDWHIYWALEMCWLYTENAPTTRAAPRFASRRFVIGGR